MPWKNQVPQNKIVLVLNPRRTMWNMGSRNEKPAMQIMTSWYATNTSDIPLNILNAGLIKPDPKGRTLTANTFMVVNNIAYDGTRMPVQPHQTLVVEPTFFLDPPTRKENEELILRMYVVDQYGRKHYSPKVKLKYRFPSAESF